VIKLSQVSKEYAPRGRVLDEISFEIAKGEFAFLTGHSGSGKPITLKLIHMADRPSASEVRVTGYSSQLVSRREIWKVRRRRRGPASSSRSARRSGEEPSSSRWIPCGG